MASETDYYNDDENSEEVRLLPEDNQSLRGTNAYGSLSGKPKPDDQMDDRIVEIITEKMSTLKEELASLKRAQSITKKCLIGNLLAAIIALLVGVIGITVGYYIAEVKFQHSDIQIKQIEVKFQNSDAQIKQIAANFNKLIASINISVENNTRDIQLDRYSLVAELEAFNSNITQFVKSNTNQIDTNRDLISSNSKKINTNLCNIKQLNKSAELQVSFCGYKFNFEGVGVIHYEKLTTNVNTPRTGGLDVSTGIFTAPVKGTYIVAFNFRTGNHVGNHEVYLYKNGIAINEFDIHSSSQGEFITSGRTLTVILKDQDFLAINATENVFAGMWDTTFCITLIK